MDKYVETCGPVHPTIPLPKPSEEAVSKLRSIWDIAVSAVKKGEEDFYEAELIPESERLAFMNFYRNGKKIFHANLWNNPTGLRMDLFEDYAGHSRIHYKTALLGISQLAKQIGISELEVTIQDSSCSAPNGKAMRKTMELIGLQRTGDGCGDFLHETTFVGKWPILRPRKYTESLDILSREVKEIGEKAVNAVAYTGSGGFPARLPDNK